jgi:ABC-type multidrug transport system fused ATPase/permease subunit
MQSDELDKIFSYVLKNERNRLFKAPEEAVRIAVQKEKITCGDEEIAFIASVLSAWSQVANSQYDIQRRYADQRIDKSIQAMRHAFHLTLVMYNVMFYLGVALVVIGVISAFNGRAIAGITLGGVGLIDLMFFLIREPIEGIQESIGNLTQLRTTYNSYFAQLKQWPIAYDHQYGKEFIEIKQDIIKVIHQDTVAALDLIQKHCKLNSIEQKKTELH